MQRIRWILVVFTLAFAAAAPRPALAWGREGHPIVAEVATAGLGPTARTQVADLLGNQPMSAVALWADDMRTWQGGRTDANPNPPPPTSLAGDAVALAFFNDRKNDKQPEWHFIDLPIGTDMFAPDKNAGLQDNAVDAIRRCVAVLRGQPFPNENIMAPQALRLLIHYVGDIHQPLHSSSGFWLRGPGGKAVLAQPGQVQNAAKDNGGNALKFSNGDNFHSFWDTPMVRSAQGDRTRAQYVQSLVQLAGGGASAPWTISGDPLDGPAKWALESVLTAKKAYDPLDASNLTVSTDKRIGGTVRLPNDYADNFKTTVDQQLARAGFRLAATLNAIFP